MAANVTPVLLSVNVSLPRNVSWQGKTVYTGVWKHPVDGPAMVRRLNIDSNGQGDTNGHGGEQRAVLVYQDQSYRHWQQYFGRDDLNYGSFGENFTVAGLANDEAARAGQYLTLRVAGAGQPAPVRNYSLSSAPGASAYRISVKAEPDGAASGYLNRAVRPGAMLEAAAPRGDFVLDDGAGPVLLLSAGIGVTPVLAMLHELAAARSTADATAYVCGPDAFMAEMRQALTAIGIEVGTGRRSVLELADACDVPSRWSCRSGVCHTCVTPLLSGQVRYAPDPLEPPAGGQVLICCAQPDTDLVLDM